MVLYPSSMTATPPHTMDIRIVFKCRVSTFLIEWRKAQSALCITIKCWTISSPPATATSSSQIIISSTQCQVSTTAMISCKIDIQQVHRLSWQTQPLVKQVNKYSAVATPLIRNRPIRNLRTPTQTWGHKYNKLQINKFKQLYFYLTSKNLNVK